MLVYILYRQVFENRQLGISDFCGQWQSQWQAASFLYLGVAVFLMPLNWALEVAKWLPTMQKVEAMSIGRAAAAVLAGAAVSMFTPNRIGEYGGRVLLVAAENRGFAVVVTLLGSWAQWMMLLAGGLLAFFGLAYLQPQYMPVWAWCAISAIALAFLLLLMLMYRNIQRAIDYLARYKWLKKWLAPVYTQMQIHRPNATWLSSILLMAAARYLVYSTQYILMLFFWGVPLDFLQMLVAVGLIYFIQTGIPLPPSTGLLARGNIALFIFGIFLAQMPQSDYIILVLSATFSLWLLNVLLPALLGGGVLIYCMFWRKDAEPTTKN
jgi:MFS family permease